MYDDNYQSCHQTFVTLRIYYNKINPEELSSFLDLNATSIQYKGKEFGTVKKKEIEFNGWFFSTEGIIESKDCRRHIDYLTTKFIPIKNKLAKLIEDGAEVDLSCFWSSENGQGGPTLSQKQFSDLSNLGIELWFDIY